MKAIIFGINGQDGYYLNQLLQQQCCEVIGVSRSGNYLRTNIADYDEVSDLIKTYTPDYIFHFAANSTTQHAALFENHSAIATGTLNILEAVRNCSPFSKVFISGSALQFKNDDTPVKETNPFEARDAYSISRIQSVYAARYFRSLGVQAYVGYFFNHDSPLRTERHITKKITETVKRIQQGSSEKLKIGDASVIKEWSFAGDIVKAVWTLVNQNEIWEANIGSGLGYSIEEWIEVCFSIIHKNWKKHVLQKPDFIADYHSLVSDPSLIYSLGWKPEISFEDLARMMIST